MDAEDYNSRELEFGRVTRSDFADLVRRWQEVQGLIVDGKLGPQTVMSLRVHVDDPDPGYSIPPLSNLSDGERIMLLALDINVASSGEGETDGNNRGEMIDYWRETDGTGIGPGGSGPWCATLQSSSLCRAADQFDLDRPCRMSRNAKRLGDSVGRAGRYLDVPERGCLVVWSRGTIAAQGHIGQALSYDPKTDSLTTIEGNKNRPGELRAYVGEFVYRAGSWRDRLYCLSTLAAM